MFLNNVFEDRRISNFKKNNIRFILKLNNRHNFDKSQESIQM